MNHEINMENFNIRTDLAIEEINDKTTIEEKINDIKVTTINIEKDSNMKKRGKYITIEFSDITDFNNSKNVENVFITKLKKLLKENNIKENDTCLVIGLGNEKSTPDSLGPLSVNNIIVTRHFYCLNIDIEKGFRNVAAINPNVMGQTGIETSDIISAITNKIKPDFIIVIDSLKSSKVNRINKTIQITDAGINPGSGIGNNRKEISKEILGIPVFAIGIPTVVDTITIINESFNEKEIKKLSDDEVKKIISKLLLPTQCNMIVTPTDIDFQIQRLSEVLSNGINNTLHKNVTKL
ncbi:MAG: GPR endopeptidase [Bacilli bacterium]|nr:GPR endopeptidase [Bacilli bacterium]